MDLAPYRQKYGRFPVERRDWPVSTVEFARFARHGSAPSGAAALIWNRDREVLLVRENRQKDWTTPGGFAELAEMPDACAVREAKEEAGVEIRVTRLTKVVICHVSEGDRVLPFTFFQFEAELLRGRIRPGKGVSEAIWSDRLPAEMHFRWDYLEPWLRGRPSL